MSQHAARETTSERAPDATVAAPKPRKRIRQLPTQPHRDSSFGISDCHRMLVRDFGAENVPALVTLKRQAASGALNHLRAPRRGTEHPKYNYLKLREHFRPRKPATAAALHGRRTTGAPAAVDPAVLAAAIDAAVSRAIEPLAAQLQQIQREVTGLAAVRQSLMLKYDAATNGALTRADQAQQHLQDVKRLLDVDNQIRQLRGDIAKLAQSLGPRAAS